MAVDSNFMLQLLQTEQERVLSHVSTNDFGFSLLHAAANYPDSLARHLQTLKKEQILPALKGKDRYGNSLLYHAAANSKSLAMVLALYPSKEELLKDLQEANLEGQTVLHAAAEYSDSLALLKEYYSTEELLATAKIKDKNGNSALHAAASNAQSLSFLGSLYPEQERGGAFEQENAAGDTVMHLAASYPDSLCALLAVYSAEKHLPVLKKENKKEESVLFLLRHHPHSLKVVLCSLSVSNKLALVQDDCKYGYNFLHWIHNPEALKNVLLSFSESVRLRLVTEQDKKGYSLLERLIQNSDNHIRLRAVLESFPATQHWFPHDSRKRAQLPFADANKIHQLLALYEHLAQLKSIGIEWVEEKEKEEGVKVIQFADEMYVLLHNFIEAKRLGNTERQQSIQGEFKMKLEQGYKEMRSGSELLCSILINIAIAATGIGLLFIIRNLLTSGNTFFESPRQKMVSHITNSFDELIDHANKAASAA